MRRGCVGVRAQNANVRLLRADGPRQRRAQSSRPSRTGRGQQQEFAHRFFPLATYASGGKARPLAVTVTVTNGSRRAAIHCDIAHARLSGGKWEGCRRGRNARKKSRPRSPLVSEPVVATPLPFRWGGPGGFWGFLGRAA